jgi:hypothetical protein
MKATWIINLKMDFELDGDFDSNCDIEHALLRHIQLVLQEAACNDDIFELLNITYTAEPQK